MKIKQVSVFVENQPGRLFSMLEVLEKAGINMRALSVSETAEFGIVRMILDNPEAGLDAFTHTMEIRSLVTVPILISGGISSVTAPFAPATGCDGIGVGSAVSKQPDVDSMAKVAQDIISGIRYAKTEGKIIV